MKKVMSICAAVVAVAGVASADLSVDWFNTSVAVTDDGATSFINDNLVQLIWSASSDSLAAGGYAVAGGSALAGEYILNSTTDHAANPPVGFWGPLAAVYGGADVGGADINTGYFFTRVFETATADAGTAFYDTARVDASAWVYDNLVPGSTYSQEFLENNTPYAAGGSLDVNANGTTVIPEPATIGLMGIAGLGMFLARRKSRR